MLNPLLIMRYLWASPGASSTSNFAQMTSTTGLYPSGCNSTPATSAGTAARKPISHDAAPQYEQPPNIDAADLKNNGIVPILRPTSATPSETLGFLLSSSVRPGLFASCHAAVEDDEMDGTENHKCKGSHSPDGMLLFYRS
ncbi:hypothetical protein BKA66DRAFT_99734 [Pyrenochaeta sp. MPI-SDFR-AT-0127]|nr:hypothetical protein BKA66DRAFT_99734 [Pyrenochaeta sp. MPI-SDFR-AT-0127]